MEGSRDLEKYVLAILETVFFLLERFVGREDRFRWNVISDITLGLQLEKYLSFSFHRQISMLIVFSKLLIYVYLVKTHLATYKV